MMSFSMLPLASQLITGAIAWDQHNQYAKMIEEQELNMPESMIGAEQILKDTAGAGLPGAESMKEEIMANLAQTIQSGREVGTPSQLLGLLSSSAGRANKLLRDVNIQDEDAKLKGKLTLANFLMGAKAPMELRINQFENEKKLAIAREKMAGTSELIGGVSSGVAGTISAMGQEEQNGFQQEYLDILKDYYGSADGSVPPPAADGGQKLPPPGIGSMSNNKTGTVGLFNNDEWNEFFSINPFMYK